MSLTFTKLFSSITESTIWSEPDHVRILWITMLAMADKYGRVWGSVPGLANRARLNVPQTEDALGRFQQPDKYSRTPDNEGRRIEVMDGGWRLLNHGKYREIRDQEAIKESKRKYINARRAKEREAKRLGVTPVDGGVEKVERGRPNAEASTDTESYPSTTPKPPKGFDVFWKAFPRKEAKGAAEKAWQKIPKPMETLPLMLSAIERQKKSDQWRKEGGQFIPHPATWLNKKRWLDEAVETGASKPAEPAIRKVPDWTPLLQEIRTLLSAKVEDTVRLRELGGFLPKAGWEELDKTTEWNRLNKIVKGPS